MNLSSEGTSPVVDAQGFGEALVAAGCLSENDLSRVIQMRESSGDETPIASLLIRLGLVSETDIANQLSSLYEIPLVNSRDFPADAFLRDQISYRFLKENHVLPLFEEDGKIVIAMADPQDSFAVMAIEEASGQPVTCRVGVATELDNAVERLYGEGHSKMGDILAGVETDEQALEQDIEQLKDMASEAPVIRLVNLIIQRAVEARASDIHIEPFENWLKVRYRIDGVLKDGEAPPVNMSPAVISRIKIMAKLNIAERRLPQDGRIEMRLQGKDLDIRVSTVPTMHGESVVLRLLDRETADTVTDNCLGAYSKQDYAAAAQVCRNEAEKGSAESAFTLAVLYAKGLGVEMGLSQAINWLRVAAEAGHSEAAYNLGMAYTRGDSVAINIPEAVRWFKQASEAGNAKAQRDLATLYVNGYGVEQDATRAFLLYKASAEQGLVLSQLQTGLMLLRGEGVARNPEEAQMWLSWAAQAGDPTAQYTMGLLLSDSNPEASYAWYRKASAQGNGYAMHNLALFYLYGRGVTQDYAKALNWAEKSIAAGVSESKGLQQQILQLMGKNRPEAYQYAVVRDAQWLIAKPDEDFLIQISRQNSEKAAYAYLKKHKVTGPVGIYREALADKTTYIVTYGDFRDLTSAKAAIKTLPEGVQRFKPWVRSYKSLKQVLANSLPVTEVTPVVVEETPVNSAANHPVETKSPVPASDVVTSNGSSGRQPARWLLDQPKSAIAVQLMAVPSSRESEIKSYLKRHGLTDAAVYYETQRDAGPHMVVVLNRAFKSSAQARKVVSQLPAVVQRSKPWVRTFGSLQSKYRPLEQPAAN